MTQINILVQNFNFWDIQEQTVRETKTMQIASKINHKHPIILKVMVLKLNYRLTAQLGHLYQ